MTKSTKKAVRRVTYKVRLYPTAIQEIELLHILEGCKFVWNHFVSRQQDNFKARNRGIPFRILAKELIALRKTHPALIGLQLSPLTQSLRRLDRAYVKFYRKQGGLPQVKGEVQTSQSFQKDKDWRIIGKGISIQKDLIVKTRGLLPSTISRFGTIVIKHVAGLWYASILTDEEMPISKRPTRPIGIDVGLTHLAVTNDGQKFPTLKPDYILHHRMKILKQKMARQQIGSNRREETRQQMARLYLKMSDIRTNHLHQTSHAVLKKRPSMIAIETLHISGMMKNHKLARSLADVSLGEFHRQLRYKQVWSGGRIVEVDPFFPSTKTCSECGYINQEMKLSTRNWTCLGCGAEHDRDINAAKNLLKQGRGTPSVEVAGALPVKRRLMRDTKLTKRL